MRTNRAVVLALFACALGAAALAACGGGTEPRAAGRLDGRIVAGQNQRVIAGVARLPDRVIDQVVRVPLTTAALRTYRIGDWFLPQLAFAQTTDKATKIANAVLCVKEDQYDMIPLIRCANTDSAGNAAWVFLLPTKAGAYEAGIGGIFGTEVIDVDTVKAVVEPDVADPNFRFGSQPLRCSPAEFADIGVRDKYGNAVPYRIVSDNRIVVQDTVVGSVGARTVTFDEKLMDGGLEHIVELHGKGDAIVGYLRYAILNSQGSCGAAPYIDWASKGTNVSGW